VPGGGCIYKCLMVMTLGCLFGWLLRACLRCGYGGDVRGCGCGCGTCGRVSILISSICLCHCLPFACQCVQACRHSSSRGRLLVSCVGLLG